ncbi:MAG: ATP-binding protein [Cellulosilyticaceae bacterium]
MVYGEKELEEMLDHCLNLAWIKDKENKLIYVNQAYLDRFGKSREELIGKTEEAFCEGSLADGEIVIQGETHYFEVNEVELGETDEWVGKMGVAYEVTQETRIHRTIQKIVVRELAKMRPHIDQDVEVVYEALNVWERYFLYGMEPIGKQIYIYSEEKAQLEVAVQTGECLKWDQIAQHLAKNEINENFRKPFNRKDMVHMVEEMAPGDYKAFLFSEKIKGIVSCRIPFGEEYVGMVQLYFDEEERIKIESTVPYMKEITKNLGVIIKNIILSKQVSHQLKNMESKSLELESYFELTTDYIGVIDEVSMKVTPLTKSWSTRKLYLFRMSHGVLDEVLIEACQHAKRGVGTSEVEVCYQREENQTILWQVRFIPKNQQFLIVGRDITSRKTLEEKKQALEIQMEKEKVNRELLKHMSMWFEKPIGCIKEDLRHLEAAQLSYGQEYVKMISSNTGRIQKMLEHIMANGSERYSEEEVHYRLCDVVQEIKMVVESMQAYVMSEKKKITFCSEAGALVLSLDPEKLEHILMNLISNALKYTKEGDEIIVCLRVEEDEFCLHVMDNGEGIPVQRIQTVFERFSEQSDVGVPKKEGSGIGLSTVKKFVGLHRGTVEARSEWGIGTEIIVRVPRDLTKSIQIGRWQTTLSPIYLKAYRGRELNEAVY